MFEIKLFLSDNSHTFIKRIASHLGSIPEFCYIIKIQTPTGDELSSDIHTMCDISTQTLIEFKKYKSLHVDALDMLSICANASLTRQTLLDFIDQYKLIIKTLDILGKIVSVWFYTRISKHKTQPENVMNDFVIPNEYRLFDETFSSKSFADMGFDIKPIKPTLLSSETYVNNLAEKIRANAQADLNFETAITEQQKILPAKITKFEEERIRMLFQTNVENLAINEIFDAVVLSSEYPIAILNNFYKVFKNIQINTQWINDQPFDKIIVKYVVTYENVIDITFELREKTLFISAEIEPTGKLTSRYLTSLIPQIVPTLGLTFVKQNFENITGVFYVPNVRLNIRIFEHMVMNDKRFSNFFVDESAKPSREKSSIYTYFESSSEMVAFILTPKFMDRYDVTMRGKSEIDFPEKSPYLRVRVLKIKSMQALEQLSDSFSRLITLYKQSESSVVKLYQTFGLLLLKDADTPVERKYAKTKKFIELDPTVFSGKYTRQCPNRPRVFDKKEDLPKGSDFLVFPKTVEEGKQHYYTCHNENDDPFKYVGLIKNNSTTVKHKYVPCCFKTEQTSGNTHYLAYYEDQEHPTRTVQQRLVHGIKILEYGKYATLDDFGDVGNLFKDPDQTYRYIRWSVDHTRMSFLQCIVEAMEPGKYDNSNIKKRTESLIKIIREIANDDSFLETARQTFFDKTTDEIKEILLNENTVFSPKLFTQLFEHVFNCRIYTFSDTTGMIIPISAKTYITDPNFIGANAVFLLENYGSQARANVLFPTYEIIVRLRGKTDVAFNYSPLSQMSVIVGKIYESMTSSNFGTDKLIGHTLPAEIYKRARWQIINAYGKTNGIITDDQTLIYIYEPIAPLPLPESKVYTVKPYDVVLNNVKLLRPSKISTVGYMLNGNSVISAIEFRYDKIKYCIPVIHSVGSVDKFKQLLIPNPNIEPELNIVNKLRKLATFVTELMLYVFSKYVRDSNIAVVNNSVIEVFVRSNTVIDGRVNYTISRSYKDAYSMFTTRDGKMIIQSEELLKRLVYTLRLQLTQRMNDILNYYKRVQMENFTIDVLDFTEYPLQIIVDGKQSMMKYITDQHSVYNVSSAIDPYEIEPYMFKNSIIENQVFFALNVDTIEQAQEIAEKWGTSWDTFVYNSEIEIKPIDVTGSKIKLLIYNIDSTLMYTVLFR